MEEERGKEREKEKFEATYHHTTFPFLVVATVMKLETDSCSMGSPLNWRYSCAAWVRDWMRGGGVPAEEAVGGRGNHCISWRQVRFTVFWLSYNSLLQNWKKKLGPDTLLYTGRTSTTCSLLHILYWSLPDAPTSPSPPSSPLLLLISTPGCTILLRESERCSHCMFWVHVCAQ